jgi:6-bladed beta-propeller
MFAAISMVSCVAPSQDSQAVAIQMDTVAVVHFAGMPAPSRNAKVTVSPTLDRIAVALGDQSGEVLVFDGEGQLVDRLGRRGEGPGEHRQITSLLYDDHDSLFVFDAGNARASVYGPAHRFIRDFPLPGTVFHAAWAASEHLAIQGRFQDARFPEYKARLVTPTSVIPIAPESGLQNLRSLEDNTRPLTSSRRGGVWVSLFRGTVARRFDSAGIKVDSIAIAAPWMEARPENADIWQDLLDVQAAVLDISEDADGRIWFLSGVPPERLPRPRGDPADAIARGELTPTDFADHILAVSDDGPRPVWLATRRFDFFLGGLLPRGFAYWMTEDESGEPAIVIEKMRLLRHPSSRGKLP